jgi:uncharacterized coiled-coil DUF342 family protein
MKRISKTHAQERDALIAEFRACEQQLDASADAVQHAVEAHNLNIEKLNEIIGRINELRQTVHGEIESYHDERSDAWKESDRAGEYLDWMQQWESDVEEMLLMEVDLPVVPSIEDFEQAGSEVPS